jgi:hypothetical protein
VAWVVTAVLFVVFLLLPSFDNRVLQLEAGYLAAAGLLCALLYGLYRRSLQSQRPSTSSNLPSE